jgi:periplasmic protein CpxP/Spy
MKKIILSICLLGLVTGFSHAQTNIGTAASVVTEKTQTEGKKDKVSNADKQTKHLNKALKLSADQQVSVGAILTDNEAKMENIRKTYKPGTEERKNQIKTTHEATDASLKKVFTAEQATKYDKMKAERKEKMRANLKAKLDELED